jgi:hypothetical protein
MSTPKPADDLGRDMKIVIDMISNLVTSHERYKSIIEDEENNLEHAKNRVREAAEAPSFSEDHEKANRKREKNYHSFGEKGSKVMQVVYNNELSMIEWEIQIAYNMLMAITTLLTGYLELLKVPDSELITKEGLEACEALSTYVDISKKYQESLNWKCRSLEQGRYELGGRSMRVFLLIRNFPSKDSEKMKELESHWTPIFRQASFAYRAFKEIKHMLDRIKEINDDTMDIEQGRQKST